MLQNQRSTAAVVGVGGGGAAAGHAPQQQQVPRVHTMSVTFMINEVVLKKSPLLDRAPREMLVLIVLGQEVKTIKSCKFIPQPKNSSNSDVACTYIFDQQWEVHVRGETHIEAEIYLTTGQNEPVIGSAYYPIDLLAHTTPYTPRSPTKQRVVDQNMAAKNLFGTWVPLLARSASSSDSGSTYPAPPPITGHLVGQIKMYVETRIEKYEGFLDDSESDNSTATTPASALSMQSRPAPSSSSSSMNYLAQQAAATSSALTPVLPVSVDAAPPTFVGSEASPRHEIHEQIETTSPPTSRLDALAVLDAKRNSGRSTNAFLLFVPLLLALLAPQLAEIWAKLFATTAGVASVISSTNANATIHFPSPKVVEPLVPPPAPAKIEVLLSSPAAPSFSSWLGLHTEADSMTLRIGSSKGKRVQLIDLRDNTCLYWKSGLFGGHAKFAPCSDKMWWVVKPNQSAQQGSSWGASSSKGLVLEHQPSGKCLCPKRCGRAESPFVLKRCGKCECGTGWALSEGGQLELPIVGGDESIDQKVDSVTCVTRKLKYESAKGAKAYHGKATLGTCYLQDAVRGFKVAAPMAIETVKGNIDIQIKEYSFLATN